MEHPLEKIDAKKSLGQHFLNNPRIPEHMAEAGRVEKGDTVLEIGPGTGVLTRELLKRGARVIAIEADKRAIESLEVPFKAEIANKQLVIYHTDIRTATLTDFGVTAHSYKVVANIPYYLSGRLFRLFLETEIQPTNLVFLVQKEVALRIVRDPKESLLSLSVKVFGVPTYVKTVGRGNFNPPPRVDSAIIAVDDISNRALTEYNVSPELFFHTIHEGFKSKRKQLLGNLSDTYDRAVLTHIFSTLNIPLTVRGEDVPLTLWLKLTKELLSTESPQK